MGKIRKQRKGKMKEKRKGSEGERNGDGGVIPGKQRG